MNLFLMNSDVVAFLNVPLYKLNFLCLYGFKSTITEFRSHSLILRS